MDYVIRSAHRLFTREWTTDNTLNVYLRQPIFLRVKRKNDSDSGVLMQYDNKYIILRNFDLYTFSLNGFILLRRKDCKFIKKFKDENQELMKALLESKNQLEMISSYNPYITQPLSGLLITLMHIYPICTVYTENVDYERYFTGKIYEINGGYMKMQILMSDNTFSGVPVLICIDEITRVEWDRTIDNNIYSAIQFLNRNSSENNEFNSFDTEDDTEEDLVYPNPVFNQRI